MATATAKSPAALKLDNDTVPSLSFEPFTLPASNQRELGAPHPSGTVIPLALKSAASSKPTLDDAISTIRQLQQTSTLTNLLATHGTLLFRGLPISSAADFSRFAHAFNYHPHEIIGIVVDRQELAPNVAPANEAPPNILIYNHNESPQVPHAPEYIMFYGHTAPQNGGGETPISSSLELFHRAQSTIPEFISKLSKLGILSRVHYHWQPQHEGGSTLAQAFGKKWLPTDDLATKRAKVEAQIARYNRGDHTTYTWTDSGLVVEHRLPAIRTQQSTNLPTLFTALAAYYKNPRVNKLSPTRAKVTEQLYGDGTEIEEKYLQKLVEITDEIRVLHKWESGDVLVYDNVVAQHGREPWVGGQEERRVLASLWDSPVGVPGGYWTEEEVRDTKGNEWKRVVPALSDEAVGA